MKEYPVGTILASLALYLPNNWVRADGRTLSRFDYEELFDKMGVMYGHGDGKTTFNIPNSQKNSYTGEIYYPLFNIIKIIYFNC